MLFNFLRSIFRRSNSPIATPKQHLDEEIQLDEKIHLDLQPIRLLAEQGQWISLEERTREILTEHASSAETITLLAYSLQQQKRLVEAAEFASQAAVLSPDVWFPNFIAGVALKELGKTDEACKYLRQAISIAPDDKQTLRQLVEAIAASSGIELAASEYAAHCSQRGAPVDIVAAPLCTVRDWAETVGLPLLEVGDVEEIPFKAPHVWGSPPASEITFAPSNKPYVADIANARIFSNSSLILTSDGTVLSDTGGHPRFGRYVSFAYETVVLAQRPDKVLLNFNELETREIEAGMLLSGLASSAFGHWLPEFLPKLQFLQQHPDYAGLPLIVDANMPQSHFEHLRRITDNPLILLQANESLLCRRLLFAPSPAFLPVELFPNDIPTHEMPGLSPRAMRFLQGDKPLDRPKHLAKRIFLTRKNMKWRRLLNEAEIIENLAELGFESVLIEELTIAEQIDLFRQAEWIVAPNGSALLNLIFADQEVKLLVLTQPNLFNWGTFQGPMDSLGYQSICVAGDYAMAEDQKHSDYHIPVSRIRQALSYLGMSDSLA